MSRRFHLTSSFFALAVFSVVLSGCMVGPNYKKPVEKTPPGWVEVPKGISTEQPVGVSRWWIVFDDPVLDSLVDQAAQANKDLKMAYARIYEARAQRAIATAGLFPTLNASASYTAYRNSGNASPSSIPAGLVPPSPGAGGNFSGGLDLFQGGFDASWELDIFGRTRRTIEAANASLEASEEDYRDTLVTLFAEVAADYLNVRGTQLRLVIAKKNIEAQTQTVELTSERFEAGLSSELDVAQAKAQLASTESQVPTLETTAKQAMYQLATLLGTTPSTVVEQLSVEKPLPAVPVNVPVGIPSDLLRRRPDVRRAERQLAAATANIGVATADLFPRFNLLGDIGQSAMNFSNLVRSSSTFWSLGPGISWNIFNAGSVKANIEVQKAKAKEALANYEKTVLVSLQDVESALVAYTKERGRRDYLADAVKSNERAYQISSELYIKGLVDFLRVLDSQRSLYQTQDQLAVSEQLVSTDLVALYKALGGGWELPPTDAKH
jgi:multidrug efflux system outer membrane protein